MTSITVNVLSIFIVVIFVVVVVVIVIVIGNPSNPTQSVGCSLLRCPPFTELAQTPIPGECCPKQECVPKCPPPCTRKLCKSNQKSLCSM